MRSLSEGKRACIKEAWVSVTSFFCSGLKQAAACLLPRLRCRHLPTLTAVAWYPALARHSTFTPQQETYTAVFVHSNLCWLAQFWMLCTVEKPIVSSRGRVPLVTSAPWVSLLTYFLPFIFCLCLFSTYNLKLVLGMYFSFSGLIE